ncbi:MAG TPA: M23 family metallopeptidase [Gemmatimonadaceae bacterium]|nr:M23 family metallopeptidase [Gemmatimonadaceae bacterium]
MRQNGLRRTAKPRRRRGRYRSCLTSIVLIAIFSLIAVATFPVLRHPIFLVRLVTSRPPSEVPIPVQGVRKRQIPNTWGAPRSEGRSHKGVDIFATRGTPVISATGGIVLRVGTNRLGGQVVNVLGPGRQVHYYAHLDSYGSFRPGDVVRAGDVIGYVGTTGNARGTPPHLHYGVYDPRHGPLNPWLLLSTR